jgi:hypothetical protein
MGSTRLGLVTGSDKRTSLLRLGINYARKKFFVQAPVNVLLQFVLCVSFEWAK